MTTECALLDKINALSIATHAARWLTCYDNHSKKNDISMTFPVCGIMEKS